VLSLGWKNYYAEGEVIIKQDVKAAASFLCDRILYYLGMLLEKGE